MSDKLRRILMAVLFIVFCVSAISFGKSFMEYRKGNHIYETAKEFVVKTDTPVALEKEEIPLKRTYADIDFNGMQAVNEDVIGWIQIMETPVDYPLLDADDNKYYLNHTYDRQWSSYGSIFLEPRNNPDLSEQHLVIYGHNMVNESMFGSLLEYKNQEYADAHPEIIICMPDRDLTYRVFSAYTAHVDSATYRMSFWNEASFLEMADYMKNNSVITSDMIPDQDDQILTLSTCTPEGAKKYRFVVNAVLLKDEMETEEMILE
ncbi:MAG: class B sortase [Anaerotignum sp.]|nr:class B sortase [Anaerotignum sp.]